jgi:hypothetical protein
MERAPAHGARASLQVDGRGPNWSKSKWTLRNRLGTR